MSWWVGEKRRMESIEILPRATLPAYLVLANHDLLNELGMAELDQFRVVKSRRNLTA